jgi:hypothetical protein
MKRVILIKIKEKITAIREIIRLVHLSQKNKIDLSK